MERRRICDQGKYLAPLFHLLARDPPQGLGVGNQAPRKARQVLYEYFLYAGQRPIGRSARFLSRASFRTRQRRAGSAENLAYSRALQKLEAFGKLSTALTGLGAGAPN